MRCYRGDLAQFARHHIGDVAAIDAAVLRGFFAAIGGPAKATRARVRSTPHAELPSTQGKIRIARMIRARRRSFNQSNVNRG